MASGVDVRLGWRVLSEGIFLPTILELVAFPRVHEEIFLPADLDHLALHCVNGFHEGVAGTWP